MASKKYFVDIDLNLNELKSIVVHKLPTASEPAGTAGQIYYNTNTNAIRFFNGSIWQDIATGSIGFDDILTGTNTSATMIVGTGSTLYYTGSGSINASQFQGYSIVPLSIGGTNANLTASDGGIVYSTASAMAILSGTSTAGQIIRSGASGAPSWSTATYPATASSAGTVLRANGTNWVASTSTFADTYTQYNLLYASATNAVTGLATANDSVLSTNGSGVPSWVSITSLLDAVIRNPSTINYNIIQPTGANTIGLVVRKTSNVTNADHYIFAVQTSGGSADLFAVYYSNQSSDYSINFNTNAGTGGTLGYVKMDSFSGRTTGFLNTSASSGYDGGSINVSAGAGASGGSITTSNGGGSIDTTGNGSIQFGTSANRITLQGTAAANGKTITLPNITGDALITAGAQTITGVKTVQADFIMDDANIIKFREKTASGTNYIGLKAPDALSGDITYILPANGTTGHFLKLVDNSTGELGWAAAAGASGFVLTVPTSSSDNIIQPTVADVEPLTVRQSSGTFASAHNVFAVQTNGGTNIFEVYRSAASTYSIYFNTNAGTGGTLGYVKMDSFSGRTTGYVDVSATSSGDGGFILTHGGSSGGSGGNISTRAGTSGSGGSILTTGSATVSGGNISTYAGGTITNPGGAGGSISTYGGGGGGGGVGGAGGYIRTYGGDSSTLATGGAGGHIDMSGGQAVTSTAGAAGGHLLTYATGGFAGGSLSLNASSTAGGGSINLSGGAGSGASGSITAQGGSSTGTGGSITMNGGSTGNSGSINLSGSSAVSGGNLTSTAGATVSGNAGGAGGSLSLAGGTGASGGTGGAGGSLTLAGGAGAASGNGGASGSITLSGGAGAAASGPTAGGNGGTITMTGGTSGGGTPGRNAGSINLSAGSLSTNVGGTGGSITMTGGAGAGGVFGVSAGSIDLSAGNCATGQSGGTGGNITMTGGVAAASSAAGGNAGSITMSGGNASSSSHPGGTGGSINTSGSAATSTANGAAGGSMNLSGGTSGANSTTGGAGGSITMTGGNGSGTSGGTGGASGTITLSGSSGSGGTAGTTGGSISTNATGAFAGGSITTAGGAGGAGGSINLSGGGNGAGGSINMAGGASRPGGSITMNDGGGSIDTTGNGSIQFGLVANRITLQGTAAANGKTITLPNITGDALITAGAQTITGVKTVQVDFVMDDANIIKFNEKIANGTSYIGLKAPDSLSASMTYLLPPNGSTGQFLKLNDNGTGELAWATPTGTVARYTTDHTFGGSGTSITVTHNLSTQYVIVRIYDSSWQEVYPQIVSTSSTQATITFAADQGTNAYHIVVMG